MIFVWLAMATRVGPRDGTWINVLPYCFMERRLMPAPGPSAFSFVLLLLSLLFFARDGASLDDYRRRRRRNRTGTSAVQMMELDSVSARS